MQKKAMEEAPVHTHHLQKSIMLDIRDGGMTAEVASRQNMQAIKSMVQGS